MEVGLSGGQGVLLILNWPGYKWAAVKHRVKSIQPHCLPTPPYPTVTGVDGFQASSSDRLGFISALGQADRELQVHSLYVTVCFTVIKPWIFTFLVSVINLQLIILCLIANPHPVVDGSNTHLFSWWLKLSLPALAMLWLAEEVKQLLLLLPHSGASRVLGSQRSQAFVFHLPRKSCYTTEVNNWS